MSTPYRVNQWQLVEKKLLWAYGGDIAPRFRDTWEPGYHYSLWYFFTGGVTVNTPLESLTAGEGECMFRPCLSG